MENKKHLEDQQLSLVSGGAAAIDDDEELLELVEMEVEERLKATSKNCFLRF